MKNQFKNAKSLKELCKANNQCKRGVSDKDAPIEWYLHSITRCKRLKDLIETGKYKPKRGVKVEIYKPKRRQALAPSYMDRVWQKSMCNNGVYSDLTKSFILDNAACQISKGNDFAIRRVVKMLQSLHRSSPGKTVFGCHLDVKKYFPSTPHDKLKQMDKEIISEKKYLPYLFEIIDNSKDNRPIQEIQKDCFGERGTGLGSQINQLHQVALLNKIDHEIKTFCRYYIRYNDDFLVLDHDREIVKKAIETIESELAKLGLTMTNKQGIFRANRGFYFLRKRFILTKSGKVIIRLHKKALVDERNVLRHLKKELLNGSISMEYIKRHYQSVISNFEYAGNAPIMAMDKFYTSLFRQKPEYKRKRRYLYGH